MFELLLEQKIGVAPERVFLAFTDADLLSAWFTTDAQVDLRVGGGYRDADGDRGKYLAVAPPELLCFTWDNPSYCPQSEVQVRFTADKAGTHVELKHYKLDSAAAVEQMRTGWEWALDNVKLFLETGATVSYEAWQKRHGASTTK